MPALPAADPPSLLPTDLPTDLSADLTADLAADLTADLTAAPRPAPTYRTPELLQDIRLLDLLELSGSMVRTSALLKLSQPTMSRRYSRLSHDFGLRRQLHQERQCRYGSSEVMRWLRLGWFAGEARAALAP